MARSDTPAPDSPYEFTPELRIARLEAAVGQLARTLYNHDRHDGQPNAPVGRRACRELIDELAMIEEAT